MFRRAATALVSGLVGYGAYYTYSTPGNPKSSIVPAGASPTEAVPMRPVLIVGRDVEKATFVGEGPLYKSTDDDGQLVLEMLTSEQVTEKLRKAEESWVVSRGKGVVRYDVAQLPSNNPIEDDHSERIFTRADSAGDADWMFWGVYDGHSGWTTSAKLREVLLHYVALELNETYSVAPENKPTDAAIDEAIKTGFLRLDDEIVHKSVDKVLKLKSKSRAAELLNPAVSGSCALVTFYDTRSGVLKTAVTGDSRAVLGRRGRSGKWTATPLSEDQTGGNPAEAARLRAAHPGEEAHVVRNGRVLGGLEPTRAFGDATYKWARDVSERLVREYIGRNPPSRLRTPPYVTAEPVVTTTRIDPDGGDFVVMASDGLWEMLSNEEVVGLVGQWLEQQRAGVPAGAAAAARSSYASVLSGLVPWKRSLPVEPAASGGGGQEDGQKVPIRQRQWGVAPGSDRFVVKDKNVATHIVRNALGGKNEEQISALLTLVAPFSRKYRDDLTVTVIFFGDNKNTGDVMVNAEASTGTKRSPDEKFDKVSEKEPIKAKL